MKSIIVIENVKRWPLALKGATVVAAKDYLVGGEWAGRRGVRVYNFCRTYGYQTVGYYVSLLAAARGHRPLPTVETLQDLRLSPVVRIVSEQMEELIQRALAPLRGKRFELSVYFGRNLSKRYDALSRALYEQFSVPLLRASFERFEDEWRLSSVRPISTGEIPESHRSFVIAQAEKHFSRSPRSTPARKYQYDLAILHDPKAEDSPSNEQTLRKFAKAAREVGIDPHLIERDDAEDIGEFDALFIRETTYVNGPTYRMSRRAATEGLIVIDDPISILRCSNKVFLAELFSRHDIPHPKTFVAHEDSIDEISKAVGLPCVLKRPDSAFSRGVTKATTMEELREKAELFLHDSELVVAQAFTASEFDWRIGVLDGEALFACRYHMAKGHWQIVRTGPSGFRRYGKVETFALSDVPAKLLDVAVRAARLIGDGLYGVDLKEIDGEFLVIEINDNPNIEVGYEDAVLGDEVYRRIMQWFRVRLDRRGESGYDHVG
ncbi:MAG: RimK family protein [Deltaproteobacteria bacterium]|nr:RimK family protein [Deltaproteobacteria bacterium]